MYGLSPEDLAIQSRARAFADELIPFEVDVELAEGRIDPEVAREHRRRARELGLAALNMPRELGGGGATTLQTVLVQEQMGRVTNGLGWAATTPPSWWPPVATPYQLERYLVPTVRGEAEECYAITEEGAGSDVASLEATARRTGDAYVLNGVKWHVTSFESATYAFFEARLVDGPHAGEHALFVVDLPSPGVRVVRTPRYTHNLAHGHPVVAFEDVVVPAENLVGAEGDGMDYARAWFRFERLMVAARCLGAMERLVADATSFARERRVRGRALVELGAIEAMLADSAAELLAARAMTYEVARQVDRGVDVKVLHGQCSLAKLFVAEAAGRVADRAVQIFGGRGYMRENAAERLWREVRVERIWEGASEVQRSIVAGQLAKRGVQALC